MPSQKDGVTIILSSPSGAGKTTLAKLLSQKKNFEISIIVVNDASNHDRSNEEINFDNIQSIKILNMKKNQGHARCIATGLKYILDKDEFDYGLEYEIEKTTRSFKVGSRQQEHNLIDALKIACRKFSKEKTGKKPFTNINLVKI